MSTPKPPLTVGLPEACRELGWHEVTGRRKVKNGTFPLQPIGDLKPYRFSRAALEALVAGEPMEAAS